MAANVNGIDLQEIAGAVASSVKQALQAQVQVTPGSEASTSKARFVCFVQLRSMHYRYCYPSARMRSEGYSPWSVSVYRSVCLSVCLHLFSHYRHQTGLGLRNRHQRRLFSKAPT